jgi:hypothetical protein
MQRLHILSLLLVACFATAISAQTPATAPKPDPELKKLAVYLGHWTYEAEYKPGPLGPGGKATGTRTFQMILGGFFGERRDAEKDAMGTESDALAIIGYDPVNKNFTVSYFDDGGGTYSGVFTLSGNTVTWSGKSISVTGKQYPLRGAGIHSADWMSYTETAEVSSDGKTWVPFYEIKYTKVKPAPKK